MLSQPNEIRLFGNNRKTPLKLTVSFFPKRQLNLIAHDESPIIHNPS